MCSTIQVQLNFIIHDHHDYYYGRALLGKRGRSPKRAYYRVFSSISIEEIFPYRGKYFPIGKYFSTGKYFSIGIKKASTNAGFL